MIKISSIFLNTQNLDLMTQFYQRLFDKQPDMQDEQGVGWMTDTIFFSLMTHSAMTGGSKDPGRILFNIETEDVKAEFQRIKSLPEASVVKEPYQQENAWIATLADPDGNYFQLMTPWQAPDSEDQPDLFEQAKSSEQRTENDKP